MINHKVIHNLPRNLKQKLKYEKDSEPLAFSLLLRGKHREKKISNWNKKGINCRQPKEALISQKETTINSSVCF